jgi:hypothetical protein
VESQNADPRSWSLPQNEFPMINLYYRNMALPASLQFVVSCNLFYTLSMLVQDVVMNVQQYEIFSHCLPRKVPHIKGFLNN